MKYWILLAIIYKRILKITSLPKFFNVVIKNFYVLISKKRTSIYFRVKCLIFTNNVGNVLVFNSVYRKRANYWKSRAKT